MSEGTRARGRLMPAPFAMPALLLCPQLLCRAGVLCCLWPRWCSGRRRARLWGRAALWGPAAVCAGGRRPARSRSALRAFGSARRLEARPGPATAHGHRSQAPSIPQDSHPVVTSHIPEPTPNFACNSPTILSNPEIRLVELQRFQTLLELHPIELHAKFGWRWCRYRPLWPSAPRASIGAPSQSPARHRCPRSAGWVNVRVKEPRCPPTGPVRYLVSIRVGRARRAARRSRRSKAPDRDGRR